MKKATKSLLLKKRDQRGFTLIELLVVIAIIGTLMAIGISNYLSYKTKGVNSSAQATAADFLTLILADTASNGVDPDGYAGTAGDPTGFSPAPNLVPTGLPVTVDASGILGNAVTFRGTDGDEIYTISTAGAITAAPFP